MMHPTKSQWWLLLSVALLIVFLWPPGENKSLATKCVNRVVDPWDELPPPPAPLPLGAGDDPYAVELHDIETQQYNEIYQRGGWSRLRLELKNAGDPLNPSTARQLLTAAAVATAFLGWRWGRRKE